MPKWLLDRLGSRSDMKLVLGKFPRYTRHVMWEPCKDVTVLTEGLDDLRFLFAAESGPNNNALAQVGGVQGDLLAVLCRLKYGLVIRPLVLRARHGVLHLGLDCCHHLVQLAPFFIYDQSIRYLGTSGRTLQ